MSNKIYDTNGNEIKRYNSTINKVPGFYTIFHNTTGRVYVGSTDDLYTRENKHRGMLLNNRHSNKNLQEEFNKDPDITFLSLNTNNREEAFSLEQSTLDDFYNSGLLFNISKDAKVPNKGLHHSVETKKQMSDTKLGKIFTEEHKKNLSNSHLGKTINENQLEGLKAGRLAIMKKVEIDNTIYESLTSAARELHICDETVRRRIKSNKFDTWKLV